jgi:hypothetical protein
MLTKVNKDQVKFGDENYGPLEKKLVRGRWKIAKEFKTDTELVRRWVRGENELLVREPLYTL